MRAGIDQAACGKLPQRLAYRRAGHAEAPRDIGFVQCRAGRQRAANDFIGELKAQLFGARDLALLRRGAVDAPDHRLGIGAALWRTDRRKIVEAHGFWPITLEDPGSSMMLTWAATILHPSGKRTQVCICRPTRLPPHASR